MGTGVSLKIFAQNWSQESNDSVKQRELASAGTVQLTGTYFKKINDEDHLYRKQKGYIFV